MMLSTWNHKSRFLLAFVPFCCAVVWVILTARTDGVMPEQPGETKNILTIRTADNKTADSKPANTPAAPNQPAPTQPAGPAGAKQNSDGTFGNDHVDPVKQNGQIFDKWVDSKGVPIDPRAVLIITGGQDGYIEPCGCSGLENQKGGMSRRHTMLQSIEKRGWKYGAIDAGGLVKGVGKQAEKKYDTAIKALREMKYDIIGLGAPELRLSVDNLISTTGSTDIPKGAIISTNIGLLSSFTPELQKRYHVITVNDYRIGVVSIVGESEYKKLNNKDLKLVSPADSIKEILPTLKAQNCQTLVMLCYASKAESKKLAEAFPEFQYVVTTDSDDNPPAEPEVHTFQIGTTEYKTKILQTSKKGMYALALGFFDDPTNPVRYQRIPLDARFADSPQITELFTKYQDELQLDGLKGLQVSEGPHPSGNGKFVGTATCVTCHKKAYDVWKDSGHAHATKTLVDLKPARHFDPECLACHVTGWDPVGYRPYQNGYKSLKETPEMMQNGCENCHGPGKNHADAEINKTPLVGQLRASMRVAKDQSTCIKCHDGDNSVKFKFEDYWPEVEHKGKD